jgi:hypothetical protein
MEALPGLSRWYIRKMPPCFGSAACATVETATNDNAMTASARTLRMFLSLDISSLIAGRLFRTIAWRGVQATKQRLRRHWQFGLR